jgi:hypothetical protein
VQLAFDTEHIRTICESSAEAIREFGQDVAYVLMARLADLDAAVSIRDVLLGRPRTHDNGKVEIELTSGYRMTCRANHPKNPMTAADVTDWDKVSRIKIVAISKS